MNKVKLNNAIGFALIFLILIVWMQVNKPTQAKLELEKKHQDSLALVESQKFNAKIDTSKEITTTSAITANDTAGHFPNLLETWAVLPQLALVRMRFL